MLFRRIVAHNGFYDFMGWDFYGIEQWWERSSLSRMLIMGLLNILLDLISAQRLRWVLRFSPPEEIAFSNFSFLCLFIFFGILF